MLARRRAAHIDRGMPLPHDDTASDSAAYLAWKGWGDQQPFGTLTAGEADYFRRELREATSAGHPVSDVLEVGFGNGTFLAYCRERGWNVAGTELGPESIAAGEQAGFAVHPAEWVDAVPDDSFDLIAAFDVLEHIPQDDIVGFLSTLASKLRPSGTLILRFPNADSWLGNPMQYGDPTHVTRIGYLKMQYFALRAGFEIAAFRATKRHGFRTSFVHGIHSMIVGPVIALGAAIARAIYFPALPVVLSTSNVICVLRRAR